MPSNHDSESEVSDKHLGEGGGDIVHIFTDLKDQTQVEIRRWLPDSPAENIRPNSHDDLKGDREAIDESKLTKTVANRDVKLHS